MTKVACLILCLMVPAGAAAQSCSQPLLEHQVDKTVEFITDTTIGAVPTMDFPTEPENLAQFVVDTLGRPDSLSLKFLKVRDPSIVRAVARVIRSWRFTPAMAGGRKVCQLVQTPVAHQRRPAG